jgi:uncharacterized protein YukE
MANPSWDDVKQVVDNPAVSYEDKKALLLAYYATESRDDPTGTHNDELEEYLDDYDISWGDGQWQATKDSMPWADSSDDRLKDAYDKGKKAADAGDERNAQHEKDKKAGQDALDASAQRASDGGAGVGNSNDLLDAGAPGLKYFENFLPVYEYAKKIIDGGSVDTNVDNMRKRYDEQRDIDFHKIDVDIVELRQVAQDSRDRQADAEKSMAKLWSGWDGKAADASRKFVTDMSARAATHADGVDHIAEVTRAACHTVSGLVNTKARTVLEGVRNVNDIAGLSPDQIKEVVDGCTAEDEAKLRRVAGFVHYTIDDSCGDGDEWKRLVRDEANKWIRGTFKPDVDGKWKQFDTICTTTKDSVDKTWEELGKQMDAINTKPFEPPKAQEPPKQQENNGDGNNNGNGNSGDTGTGSTGTGSTGTGSTGSTGTGSTGTGSTGTGSTPPPPPAPPVPEMPKPENPLDKNGDGIPDDANGDGKPDDANGDGKPDDPSGDGGKPDPSKGEEENPESVTITSGANEIKITEPDARGHVKVTVDTPNAPPKTYDLDFSKNPDAARALMAQNGAGIAQALTGQGGGGAGQGGAGQGGAGAGQGTTPGSPADDVTPIEAGADGKAVIELDGLTITTEVDPLTGEISLSVDDGEGEPQQYGVEFGQDEPADGGRPDGGRPDFTTMPAFADGSGGPGFTEPGQGFTDPAFGRDFGGQSFGDPAFAGDGGQGFAGQGQGFTDPAFAQSFGAGGQPLGDQGGQGFGGQSFAEQGFSGQGFTEPSFSEPGFTEPSFSDQGNGQQGFTEPSGAAVPPASFTDPGFVQSGFAQSGADPVFREPAASFSQEGTTSTSGASAVGGSSGFDRADSVLGPQIPSAAPDPVWGPPTPSGDAGLADTNASQAGHPGSATLPSMQDGAHAGQPAGGMMGGGMMGGAPMGGGQQQGGSGDSERGASQWRTTGSLFDDDASLGRVQGVLGEENAR